jgi:hypothetical protein
MTEQKAESDRANVAALSRAETDKIDAEGRAEATRITAAATADCERLIQLHLTSPMLRWQEIEAMRIIGRAGTNANLLELTDHAP